MKIKRIWIFLVFWLFARFRLLVFVIFAFSIQTRSSLRFLYCWFNIILTHTLIVDKWWCKEHSTSIDERKIEISSFKKSKEWKKNSQIQHWIIFWIRFFTSFKVMVVDGVAPSGILRTRIYVLIITFWFDSFITIRKWIGLNWICWSLHSCDDDERIIKKTIMKKGWSMRGRTCYK